MAWPQETPPPVPPPAGPPAAAGAPLPVGALAAGISGVLTFLFSFVRIVKVDNAIVDVGWSVWTLNVGFFGVGTLIPLAALAAGLIALGRAFVAGLDDKQALGFGALQVQIALVVMAVLVWLGYMVSIVLASDESGFPTSFGLGALLLFLGLAGLVAGTGLSIAGWTPSAPTAPERPLGVPAAGAWPAPPSDPNVLPSEVAGGPQPHLAAPPPPPAPAPPPPSAAPPAGPPAGSPPGAPAPGQGWAPPPGAPAPGQGPPPAQPPPPAGGGALIDPGTQVIPGPPPAPPPDEVHPPEQGFPPIPPSNT